MDRYAQKALFAATAENVGNLAVGVLYHFHHCKSHHPAGLRDHEKPSRAP